MIGLFSFRRLKLDDLLFVNRVIVEKSHGPQRLIAGLSRFGPPLAQVKQRADRSLSDGGSVVVVAHD